ncbi:MAG: YceI family protein [Myxococcales bacterium]|nr:YceI family protein [Myxococcales bacterium]
MKNLFAAAVLAVSGLATAATWDIDTNHANANFTVKHLGVTNVNGSLGTVTGKFNVDEKDITKSTLDVTIDVKAIYTGVQKRDDHLKSPEFFDVAKFPTATFKSTKVAKGSADNKLAITGDLTMHGVTKPVTFEAELSKEVEHPMVPGAMARAATAQLTIAREDFGLTWNAPMKNNDFVVGKDVKVNLEIELMKMGPAPKAAPAKK